MTIRKVLLAALVAGGAAMSAVPAEAQMIRVFSYETYDPAYSAAVGKPCTLKTETYIDTAAIPPLRVVSEHRCQT